MAERFVGIDVALREHRIAVLDRDGEAVGQSFTIAASKDAVATLLQTLAARDATAAQTLIGLEASAQSVVVGSALGHVLDETLALSESFGSAALYGAVVSGTLSAILCFLALNQLAAHPDRFTQSIFAINALAGFIGALSSSFRDDLRAAARRSRGI